MHARLVTVTNTNGIDSGLSYVRHEVVPAVSQHRGYRGMIATSNREAGTFMVLTWWDTAEDLEADAAAMRPTRGRVDNIFGGDICVDRLQQVLAGGNRISAAAHLFVARMAIVPPSDVETLERLRTPMWSPTVLFNRATATGVALSPEPAPAVEWGALVAEAAEAGLQFGDLVRHEVLLVDLEQPGERRGSLW